MDRKSEIAYMKMLKKHVVGTQVFDQAGLTMEIHKKMYKDDDFGVYCYTKQNIGGEETRSMLVRRIKANKNKLLKLSDKLYRMRKPAIVVLFLGIALTFCGMFAAGITGSHEAVDAMLSGLGVIAAGGIACEAATNGSWAVDQKRLNKVELLHELGEVQDNSSVDNENVNEIIADEEAGGVEI